MKAVYLKRIGRPESLVLGQIPQPQPKAGEVLVKIHASAITPTEFQWFPTFHTPAGESRPFPVVVSHEFSGVVESLGAGVENFKVGDAVFGLNDWFTNGAQADFCLAPATALARKPRLLDHVQSAVVPISALTAWQGLLEKAGLQIGQRVLIHGAAGGVGVFAVQLARWRGAHVIATASSANVDFVRRLGAREVIDHRATRFEEAVHDIDVVFDCVGGETLQRSWAVLAKGGSLVTLATQSAGVDEQRVRDAFMLVRADGSQLTQIGNLIDAGEFRVFVAASSPLAGVSDVYLAAQRGGLPDKISLLVEN
jgi:NADPH:quinone reductase-like Zn-dependent oxidoreductase